MRRLSKWAQSHHKVQSHREVLLRKTHEGNVREGNEVKETEVRGRWEDATVLALKMEKGATS